MFTKKIAAVTILLMFIAGGCSHRVKPVDGFSEADSSTQKVEADSSLSAPGSAPWLEKSSTIELDFSEGGFWVTVSGTETGAIVKYRGSKSRTIKDSRYHWAFADHIVKVGDYRPVTEEGFDGNYEPIAETVLDKEEWRSLLNSIFNSGIMELSGAWRIRFVVEFVDMGSRHDTWGLDVFIRGGDTLASFSGGELYGRPVRPPSVLAIKDILGDIPKRASNAVNAPIEAEYQKRFGKSMSDFERSVMLIEYKRDTVVFRTMSGTINAFTCWFDDTVSKLDMSDWLDIVYALGNGVRESNYTVITGEIDWQAVKERVYIEKTLRDDVLALERAYWTPSDEFKNVMDAINDKINKD